MKASDEKLVDALEKGLHKIRQSPPSHAKAEAAKLLLKITAWRVVTALKRKPKKNGSPEPDVRASHD